MKIKITLLLSLILMSLMGIAQTEKGKIYLNMRTNGAGASMSSNADISRFNLSLSPSAGLFLADNFVVGAGFNFALAKSTSKGTNYSTTSSSIGPKLFAGYFIPLSSRLKLPLFLNLDYAYSRVKETGLNVQTRKVNAVGASLSAGIAYFLIPAASLDAAVGVSQYRTALQPFRGDWIGSIFFSAGFSLYLSGKSGDN